MLNHYQDFFAVLACDCKTAPNQKDAVHVQASQQLITEVFKRLLKIGICGKPVVIQQTLERSHTVYITILLQVISINT